MRHNDFQFITLFNWKQIYVLIEGREDNTDEIFYDRNINNGRN